MKKTSLLSLVGLCILATSCGGDKTAETTKTDTVVQIETQTNTVVVEAPIDSAAVTAHYESAHSKATNTHTAKPVAHHVKKNKNVSVDSHSPVEHHDVSVPTAAPAPTSTNTQQAPAATEVIVVHDVEKVYYRPDEKGSFPGGEKAFDEYLIKNLEYPEAALDAGVQGTVYAIVSLDEQGNVKKVGFANDRLGYGLNREAERILMSSPRWNPAKHAGVPVSSKFAIPVTFKIHN